MESERNNPFEKRTLPERKNPLTSKENIQPKHAQYSSARIRPEDLTFFKNYAFINNMTIVEAISKATELLRTSDQDTVETIKKLRLRE